MPSITIDKIEYNLPPVVYDILMATADERDGYRDRVTEAEVERYRYREALEVIRDNPRFNNGVAACDIAREVLGD